jgi:adenylate cyclase
VAELPDEVWKAILTNEDSVMLRMRRRHRRYPGTPRCKQCLLPLAGPLNWAFKLRGLGPSPGNPNFCNICERFAQGNPGGVEVMMSLLFADVRGSTTLAEKETPSGFTALINRFFAAASKTLIDTDAYIDKMVGDEIIGLYLPFLGSSHPSKALTAGHALLQAIGHGSDSGPWVPVGVGINTGTAYMGTVGSVEGRIDFTAMGDAVNVTARLASLAEAGEILVAESTWLAAGSPPAEHRSVQVKGRAEPVSVYSIRP